MTKKVVVLGAGFGGLRAASLISKKLKSLKLLNKYEVILVDKNEHQTYTPLLYEVATTSQETANLCRLHEVATYRIESLIKNTGVRFVQAEVLSMDPLEGDIHLNNGQELCADFLVIALGSETNYFGIPGLEENSLPLKTFRDAIMMRDAIRNLAESKGGPVKIVIGGGGPTGVELAGELKSWRRELEGQLKTECQLNILIVEAQPSILGGLHPKVISLAEKRLRKLGVEIMPGEKIVSAGKNEVALESGKKIAFDVLVWAGGIQSPRVLTKLPLHTEAHGKPVVGGGMECLPQTPDLKLRSMVYGLGDGVCFYDSATGKPTPAVARAAIVQADVVAHNVIEEIKKQEAGSRKYEARITNYAPREYPYIVPVGGKYAIAKIGSWIIPGFDGWVIKGLVELNYLLSIMPFWRAIRIWLRGLWIFIQNDRLG
ncbi:MAG: FAD-dependent oxidoreductase [Candidatus Liptonbacteria bacterium]|nr:FAD-dependent oxidoreductase [Candidatus Liptonbacteria bacterium]